MAQQNNILQELNDLGSLLADHYPQNVYTIPTGYFEGFAEQLINRIKAEAADTVVDELNYLSPVLSTLSKENPFYVPADYFNDLEEKLMEAIRQGADYQTPREELTFLSPLLNGLDKKSPYSVPDDYFSNLTTNVASKVNSQTKAKVVSIGKSRSWVRYAAAAIFAGVIALGGFLYLNENIKPADSGKAWAKVQQKVEKLSDKELEDFVKFTGANASDQEIVKTLPGKTDEIKDLLKDVSDIELQEFLDQTSNADESILMMN